MVYVDADACPVVGIVIDEARRQGVEVTLMCDTNHQLSSDYARVVVVSAGADAVDFALVNRCGRGDIVVTQDYGVAAMALAKGALAIHQSGRAYDDGNIDMLLAERHENKKARRASAKAHLKGPAKRTADDDRRFRAAFREMLTGIKGRVNR